MSGTLKADSKLMNILLVEDNPADVLLTMEALREGGDTPHEINAVNDGLEALDDDPSRAVERSITYAAKANTPGRSVPT